MSGWTPQYMDEGVHGKYAPLCFGLNYLGNSGTDADRLNPVVKI
jgi:hypothetical protein